MKLTRTLLVLFVCFSNLSFGKKNAPEYLNTPDAFYSYCKQTILDRIYDGTDLLENYCTPEKINNTKSWMVYSDRADNRVYHSTNLSQPKDAKFYLDFMEPLAVKEVMGNWLHVYRLIDEDNNQHVDLGWVPASNLVLSSYAMLNTNGTPQKAMTLISFTDVDETTNIPAEVGRYKFFANPAMSGREIKVSRTFRIYFVLKELNGVKLLSEADVINNQNKTMIQARTGGWMANFHITNWEHRVCLEPSTSVQDYGNSKIPVFLTDKSLGNFIDRGINDVTGSVMNYNVRSTMPDPYVMRMPVLDAYQNGTRYHVATVGSLSGDLDLEKVAAAQNSANKARNLLQQVNILFVIDGTASMKPYYPAIASSIEGIINSNNLMRAGNTLRFGSVIYRDYADGNESVKVQKCTGDHQSVIDFIKSTECKSLDSDLPEAQYHGMIKGIEQAGLSAQYSNIVVLIGDAGNHRKDIKGGYTRDDVVKVLSKYEASVLAFQVINGNHETFGDFNYDAKRFIFNTGQEVVRRANVGQVNTRIEAVQNIPNTFDLVFKDEYGKSVDYFNFGRFTYASTDKPMSTDILEQNIELSCKKYFDWLVKIVTAAEGISNAKGGEYEPVVIDAICSQLKLDKEDCEALVRNVNQFSFEGYTASRFYNKSLECFVPVVFISQQEFYELKKVLTAIADPSMNKSKRRIAFQDAMINQVMAMTGDVNKEAVQKLTLNEVYEILLGVQFNGNAKYGKLAQTPLGDLSQLKKKDLDAFDDFITSFQIAARSFDISRFRSRQFEIAGQNFFWIPLSKFPGNE